MMYSHSLKGKKFLDFLCKCAKTKLGQLNLDCFLKDIPNDFFLEKYSVSRKKISSAIISLSSFISIVVFFSTIFFDVFASLLISIVVFLGAILYILRQVRKDYLTERMLVEQFSDFISNEMLLVFSSTKSIRLTIEYLSNGSYPVISKMASLMLKELNLGKQPEDLLNQFAYKQPSESLREFVIEIFIPLLKGQLYPKSSIKFESQWRLHTKFDSYLSQLEGKLSLFLAITTIIPITISMLLVILGFLNMFLVIFLPLIFFVLDLIAIEIFNSGKTTLLGGN